MVVMPEGELPSSKLAYEALRWIAGVHYCPVPETEND